MELQPRIRVRLLFIYYSTNKTTADKIEKINIFLKAGKTYDWISKELSVSKTTISDIKKSLS
jgi:uncharacterized protein YerC